MAKGVMPASVRIEGMDELQKKLRRLPDNLKKKTLMKAMRMGAKPIRDAAQAKAPRRKSLPRRTTGKPLYMTIKVTAARRRRGHSEVSLRVGPTKGGAHGILQELGTVHHAAQPFMRPAFDAHKDESVKIIAGELEDAIKREVSH